MNNKFFVFLLSLTGLGLLISASLFQSYRAEKGKVNFQSKASLEVIRAKSNQLKGAINVENQTFAWSVDISSFEGFNSPLQKEHFQESYMEVDKHPRASFAGKIIEKIDFQKNGVYSVRAKGKLNIHGVEQERIIKSTLEIVNKAIKIESTFSVALSDHNIEIPKIVHQKIAEQIEVNVEASLEPTEDQ
jgi:polyisoprenoid-binding protein YceI